MHMLATTSATLDEVEDALDLEQTPAECVVLSFSDTDLTALAEAWKLNADKLPTLRLASLKKLRHPMSVDVYIDSVIAKAKIVIVRCLGGLDYWRYGLEQIAQVARENDITFAALPGDDRPDPRLASLSTLKPEALANLDIYFRAGGTNNIANALAYIADKSGRPTKWRDPKPVPSISRWALVEYVPGAKPGRPTALIIFYRANVMAADTAPIDALMRALDREGLAPIAIALTSLKDPDIADELRKTIDEHKPTIILNATAFSSLRDDNTSILDSANVPVLQVVLSSATKEAWSESDRGLGPTDMAMNVVLPELDGRLLTRAISFKAETQFDARIEHASVRNEPHEDRVDYIAKLAANWTRLAKTKPEGRRIVLMFSDYPCRGGRTGYAVGLDTPQSVTEIINLLHDAGYQTRSDALSCENGIRDLCNATANDHIAVSIAKYERWFEALPPSARDSMTAAWGLARNDPAVEGDNFVFPCIKLGNIIIVVQPDRGNTGDKKQSYHDTTLPPRHAYAALYAWLRDEFEAHAVIHLGTHGTLEWLPGKATALSSECFPELILGPMPVIYPFIVNNPGEAVQAKRRLGAITVGHLTPPLRDAGLSGALGELEGLIEEYAEADGIDKRRIELLEQQILEESWRTGLATDCGITRADTPREAIAKLDAQLCDIKELSIRDGLHVFGRAPGPEHAKTLGDAIIAACGANSVSHDDVQERLQQSADAERTALVAALDGRRVAPGPAGAPSRGRIDVLPTGRNLTTIDPRAIPTRTAAKIGQRAADEIIRRHLQDHGDYPRALVLDLWASASLRTGGDDLAQAFAYLGVKPVWDFSSNRVTGIEVIPNAKLTRPRIDVTLRVSGLFRDIFQNQVALFDMAVEQVAALDEDDATNPLKCARRTNATLPRVFSSAPGTFGAGATDVALDGTWETADDIARAYINASKHALDRAGNAIATEHEFKQRVATADALVHPQDDRERDILDGDGVADYAGGFKAAAAMLGNDAALYHIDTSRPETPVARTFNEEITRIVRGRLTNIDWIDAMRAHGHRGVAEIAQGVDALYAFAATTNDVPSHLFDAVHTALFANAELAQDLAEKNHAATQAMIDRLSDAIERGLWTPRRNAVREELAAVSKTRTTIAPRQTLVEPAGGVA